MRTTAAWCLFLAVLFLSRDPNVGAAGRTLPIRRLNLAFDPPSTLRLVEREPIQVVPGDIVEVTVTRGARDTKKIAEYKCHWEEETGGFLGFFRHKENKNQPVPILGTLGEQISITVAVPGAGSVPLTAGKPRNKLLATRPGQLSIATSVNPALPQPPHPDAKCDPVPQPAGAVWYEVSVEITRFDHWSPR